MSKPEKIEKTFDSEPVLGDLSFREICSEYQRFDKKQKEAEAVAKDWKEKKAPLGSELQEAVKIVDADTITGVPITRGKTVRVTLVKFDDSESLNEDKLRENLMKIAKLDVVLIEKVFKASTDKVPARASYIKVTAE